MGMEAVAAVGTRTGCVMTLKGDKYDVGRVLRRAQASVPGNKGLKIL